MTKTERAFSLLDPLWSYALRLHDPGLPRARHRVAIRTVVFVYLGQARDRAADRSRH